MVASASDESIELKADSDGAWDTTQFSTGNSLWIDVTGSNAEKPKVISNYDKESWLELPVTQVWQNSNNLMGLNVNILILFISTLPYLRGPW